jgi:glycosyltransferase involved in cell wall biosynthesis
MRASVVVPTRDKPDRLRLTLRCLDAQRPPWPFEVVVVNDGAAPVAVPASARVRLVTGRGAGRAAARNAGAAASTGEFLVFCDDDILVPDDFLAAHLEAHAACAAAPASVQAIGSLPADAPRVVHGPLRELPRAAQLVRAMPPAPFEEARSGRFGRTVSNAVERLVLAMAAGTSPAAAPWLACVGGNVSMPRALWAASDGFDEAYGTTWGCEDLELGYRLYAAGAAMCVAPAAGGVHLSHVRPDRWAEHAVNMARFVTAHPDPAVAALPHLLAANGSPARFLAAVATRPPPIPRREPS